MPSKYEIGIGFVVPSTPFSRFYILILCPVSQALYFCELFCRFSLMVALRIRIASYFVCLYPDPDADRAYIM